MSAAAQPSASDAATGCCVTSVATPLSAREAEATARVFKALGDPARLRLISLIAASETGEACTCDLTDPVGLSQGTVSHHMKILTEAGLVTREQRGKWAHYAIDREAFASVAAALRL